MQSRSRLDSGMRVLVQGLFLAFPLGCMAVVAVDLWLNGFHSVFLHIGVGIFALFATLRLFATALSILDEIVWSTRPFRDAVAIKARAMHARFADAFHAGNTSLSHA